MTSPRKMPTSLVETTGTRTMRRSCRPRAMRATSHNRTVGSTATGAVPRAVIVLVALVFLVVFSGSASALQFGLHVGDAPDMFRWHVPAASAMRARMIPLVFRWDEVEPTPGRFAWTHFDEAVAAARAHDVRLVGVFYYPADWAPLARTSRSGWPSAHVDDWNYFVQRVVTRYAADIDEWMVARERRAGTDPFLAAAQAGSDVQFVQVTAAAIARSQRGARVFAAVPGADLRWLSVFFAEGGLNAVDGLVLDVSRWPAAPEGLERVVQDVAAMAAELGYAPSLWVWRFGYPTHTGLSASEPRRAGVSPDEQAAFVVRAHAILASAGVTTVLWDELVDRGRDRVDARANFGLYEEVGRGKAAAFAYATMTRMLTGMRYAAPDDLPTLPTTWGDEIVEVPNDTPGVAGTVSFDAAAVISQAEGARVYIHAHHFAGDGRHVLVVWASHRLGDGADVLQSLDGRYVRMYDMYGKSLDDLPLGSSPVYIEVVTQF